MSAVLALALLLGLVLFSGLSLGCRSEPQPASEAVDTSDASTAPQAEIAEGTTEWQIFEGHGRRGGRMVVSLTSEPKTFQPLLVFDTASRTVVDRMHAPLVRLDRTLFEVQPALASSWTVSPDRRQVRFELRRGVRFSDGEPFDADDVLFTLRAAQDPELGSPHGAGLWIDGEPLVFRRAGDFAVEIDLPSPHPAPLWLFADLPILPAHQLAESPLADAWPVGTGGAEMAGLGPFRLEHHAPGESLVLERNPHYWRRDEDGLDLPYLDQIAFVFVADENAKLLRLRAGETHLVARIPGDRFADLAARQVDGPFMVRDLGPGLGFTFLLFNLNDIDPETLPEVARRQRWLRRGELRRAVHLAIDRQAIARIVYHGHATPVASSIGPANRAFWDESLRAPERDLDAARAELVQGGFRWLQGDPERGTQGHWVDEEGEKVVLTLVTNTSNAKRSGIATLIQDDLRSLGLDVTFVGLEFSSLIERMTETFDYDLLVLEFSAGDLDPSSESNLWRLDGDSHFFHLGADEAAFDWEARLHELTVRQASEIDPAERRRLVVEAQQILVREVPMALLVSPDVLVGAHDEVGNFAPTILEHPTLWNADELFLRDGAR